MALEGSFKVLDGVDQELKNRYGQAFLNPCGAERERPPALGKAVIKSGGDQGLTRNRLRRIPCQVA